MSNKVHFRVENMKNSHDFTQNQKEKLSKMISEAYEIANSNHSDATKLYIFQEKVKTGGEWDLKSLRDSSGNALLEEGKTIKSSNEYLGNQAYGTLGMIIGLTPELLVAGAAAQQQVHDGKESSMAIAVLKEYKNGILENMNPFKKQDLSAYGRDDNSDDFNKIYQGIKDAQDFGINNQNIGVGDGAILASASYAEAVQSGEKSVLDKIEKVLLSKEVQDNLVVQYVEFIEENKSVSFDFLKAMKFMDSDGNIDFSGLLKESIQNEQNQDGEKINFDGLKDDENIENKDEEQDGQIPEQIEQNNEEQNTSWANGNATNIVELAKQNVSLYNQNINKGYDDIMSFLPGF